MIPAVLTDPSNGQPVVVASVERQRMHIEKEINEACNEFLNEPDWDKNMGIVDQLNRQPYLCSMAIKAIRAQLKTKNPEIEILALTLTESIIKNCPPAHAAVAQEDFMRYLVKVATDQRQGGKWTQLKTKMKKKNQAINSKHVRSQCIEKALLILKSLAMAYEDTKLYPVFRATVKQLKKQNVRFPETNKDESLAIFSPLPIGATSAMGSVQNPNLPMIRPIVSLAGVTHFELVQAQEQAQLLWSMINAPVLSYDLIPDLTQMLNASQQRIVVMISEGTASEDVIMQALQINDIVNSVLEDAQAIVNGTKRRYQEEVDVKKMMKKASSGKDSGDDGKDNDDVSLEHSISIEDDKNEALFAISKPTTVNTKRRNSRKLGNAKTGKKEDFLELSMTTKGGPSAAANGTQGNGNLMSAMTNGNGNANESEDNILEFLGVNNDAQPMPTQQQTQGPTVFDPLAEDLIPPMAYSSHMYMGNNGNNNTNTNNNGNAMMANNNGNRTSITTKIVKPPKQEYDLGDDDTNDKQSDDLFQGLGDPFADMGTATPVDDTISKPIQSVSKPQPKPKAEALTNVSVQSKKVDDDPFAGMGGSAFDDPLMGLAAEDNNKNLSRPSQTKTNQKAKHEIQDSNNVILDMFAAAASPDPNDPNITEIIAPKQKRASKKVEDDNPFDSLANPFGANESAKEIVDDNPFDTLDNPFGDAHDATPTDADNPFAELNTNAQPKANKQQEEFMADRDPFADM